jgi:hypothetical protein
MFNGLRSGDEGAADHKSRAYCVSVYGLFCFVGTFSAVVALFFKHGPLHLFAAYAISQNVSSLSDLWL